MINIFEWTEKYGACNVCLAKDEREVSRVEFCPTPNNCQALRLCDKCLLELSEKLILYIRENEKD